jgi:hypothetical protein
MRLASSRFLGQIKRPVVAGMPVARHRGGEHADLAGGDLPRRARVLACNPAGRLALLQKAGLVDDKNRLLIGQRFQRVIAHNVAQRIGVPVATAKDRFDGTVSWRLYDDRVKRVPEAGAVIGVRRSWVPIAAQA